MGSVWEGRHASLGTRVAIKFVDQEHADSPEARTRFLTEARAAASIQSKHAIQIFDHGVTDDGRPYIVMELLVGEPLDARIDRLGRLALAETARILGQVCRALQRAHDAGIIHRDLKPENIFLVRAPDDDEEIAKVLDFGIAKFKVPLEAGLTSSTKTGAVLGTPYYMSPEQARGLRDIDHRTDLWSLGVIAFKCVTGVLPFEGESVGDLLVKICTGPVPAPSLFTPGLGDAFDRWFMRALSREPAGRFASATELADTLAAAAGLAPRRPVTTGGGAAPSPHGLGLGAPTHPPFPAGAVTSAPFTAPTAPLRTSRGVVAGAAVAAVVGACLGVLAVVKLVASPSAGVPPFTPRVSSAVPAAPATLGELVAPTSGPSLGAVRIEAPPASAPPSPQATFVAPAGTDPALGGAGGLGGRPSSPEKQANAAPRSLPSPARAPLSLSSKPLLPPVPPLPGPPASSPSPAQPPVRNSPAPVRPAAPADPGY
jgi:serine/threonine-protein kinase